MTFNKNIKKSLQWLLRHSITVLSCVLIIALGIVFLAQSSPGTTTIGENISTGNITASGNVTVSGDLEAKTGRAATIVVAASDSSTTTKAQADYVCDGTDDQVEIQAAIDALPNGGGKVVLSEGQFNLSNEITLDSNIWLSGNGMQSTILYLSNNTLKNVIKAEGTSVSHKTNIIISDLSIDGNRANNPNPYMSPPDLANVDKILNGIRFMWVDDSVITRVYVHHSSCNGIHLQASSQNIISDSISNENLFDGIFLVNDAFYNKVINNTVNNNHDFGISLERITETGYQTPTATTGANYNIIAYNSLTGNGDLTQGWVTTYGFAIGALSFTSYNIFIGNHIYKNPLTGMYFANNVFSNVIVGNEIQESGRDGIYISGGGANIIESNQILNSGISANNAYDGIRVKDNSYENIIQGNKITWFTVSNKSRYGIIIDAGSVKQIIMGNNVQYHATGNIAIGATGCIVRNNIGYVTENSGTATITAGQTSTTTTHSLATTPTRVQLTPTTDTAGKRYWVSAKGATTFTITIDSTHTSDITFDWRAVVGEGN